MNDDLRYRFLDKVADWGVATVEHGTDDQIAALAIGLELMINTITNPPADPVERDQAIERCVKLFFI